MTNVAQRLRHLRSAHELIQTRGAERLQASPRVNTRWGIGDVTPQFDAILRIAELLDVSLDGIAGRKESQSQPNIRNHDSHWLCQKVELLSGDGQEALLTVRNSLVKRSHISRVMAE